MKSFGSMIFSNVAAALKGLFKSFQCKSASNLPDNIVIFGFLLQEELVECSRAVMQVFGVTDFDRDYENVWEWVEGKNESGFDVNISRPHNWKQGLYDKPVVVRVDLAAERLTEDLVVLWATGLSKNLNVEVWRGYLKGNPKDSDDLDFVIEQRFSVPKMPMTSSS